MKRLESLEEQGKLEIYSKRIIVVLMKKVINKIAEKYRKVSKGVNNIMGGRVITTDADIILNRGIKQGRVEGRIEGVIEMVRNLMESMGMPIEQALNALKIPKSEHEKYIALI